MSTMTTNPAARPHNAANLPRGTQRVVSATGNVTYLIGVERAWLRDAYHSFLRASWWASIAVLGAAFVVVNIAFAGLYLAVGGVEGVGPGGWGDAFFFSVQTMATIGYGVLHPTSSMANTVVIVESFVGIMITALSTGLLFAKFSRPDARVRFSRFAVITENDGKPTLMFRLGNQRSNLILEATTRVTLSRTEHKEDGNVFYRLLDLPLVRERSPAMSRGFTVMHIIDDNSPLFQATAATMKRDEIELMVTVVGLDETTMQTIHARYEYRDDHILHNHRLADTIHETDDGAMVVDLTKFHDVTPVGERS
jgi:inward rectifier potassium channel